MDPQSAPREVPPRWHHHSTAASSSRRGSFIVPARQLHHPGTAPTSSWQSIFVHPRLLEPPRSPKPCHESGAFLLSQSSWRNKILFICLLKVIFISCLWTAFPQRLSSPLAVNLVPLSDAETPLSSEILCSPQGDGPTAGWLFRAHLSFKFSLMLLISGNLMSWP